MSQILIDTLLVCLAVAFVWQTFRVDQLQQQNEMLQQGSHSLCKDKPSKTAWVAYRKGEARCFLESDNYPHRAMGSNIDD